MHKQIYLFLWALLLVGQAGVAQTTNTTRDTMSINYQQWLNDSGLSRIFTLHSTERRGDSLRLYLAFQDNIRYAARSAWEQIDAKFRKEKGYPLPNRLFFAFVHIYKQTPDKAALFVFDTYDLNQAVCMGVAVRMVNGELKTDYRYCKAKSEEIVLEFNPTHRVGKMIGSGQVAQLRKKAQQFLREKYANKPKEGYADLSPPGSSNPKAKIEVRGLRREVLYDAGNSWWCTFWNWFHSNEPCTAYPREKLLIEVLFTPEEGRNWKMTCTVTGWVGSGSVEKLSDSGYRNMEEEFDSYLTRYTTLLTNELAAYFQK
ncbi:MAG: hypothetical protein RMJ44_09340 [Cytophagales bacterium]|nr:hypothetical protein [Cytophagales bacterium]